MWNKKGQDIGGLVAFGIGIVVLAMVLAISAQVIGETGEDFLTGANGCNAANETYNCDVDYNVTQQGLQGLDTVAGKIGLIALAVVGVFVIGLLVRLFRGGF